MSSRSKTTATTGIQDTLIDSLRRLEQYVRVRRYQGIDPYDALDSPFLRQLPGVLPKLAATQAFVYSPLNPRRIFKVREGRNPKAVALFLSAYCDMFRAGLIDKETLEKVAEELAGYLIDSHIKGYHGYCWGIYFDLLEGRTLIEPGMPAVVPTSFAGNAFLDVFEITKNGSYLDMALSCCDFILHDLNIFENGHGIYFSYRPNDHKVVHNANLLGASLLSRASSYSKKSELLDYARRAVEFSVENQEEDGSWAYSLDPSTGSKRVQLDFHQGFIIDCLVDFLQYSKSDESKYEGALRKAIDFYQREQFDPLGRSMWRLPWRWPADIHHQAQGISTFAKLHGYGDYLPFSSRIATWTVENMQDGSGYFYHQKYPVGANKIAYMRWGQAWMMYSLSHLVRCLKENEEASRLK